LSKKNYYQNFFKENSSNLKKIWTGIRDIVNLKTKSTQGIQSKIVENNIEITDTKIIAETFNKYFSSIGSISTGVVPDKVKIAQVVPVFKNGSAIYVNNYRPISFLSTGCPKKKYSCLIYNNF
jgi:NADH:ubiquinone oxidoreductase subunit F (NADH-binding)